MNEEPQLPKFVEKLNTLGRIILIFHLCLAGLFTYLFVNDIFMNVRSGGFPYWFVFGTPIFATYLLYIFNMFILKKLGLKLEKNQKEKV